MDSSLLETDMVSGSMSWLLITAAGVTLFSLLLGFLPATIGFGYAMIAILARLL